MAEWKKHAVYCHTCRRWNYDIQHDKCPRGSKGSIVWLDLDGYILGCNKCNNTWPLEDNIAHCGFCGAVQNTEYRDSVVALETGDELIATDGDIVYILRRSGTVVVGRRSYTYDGYEGFT